MKYLLPIVLTSILAQMAVAQPPEPKIAAPEPQLQNAQAVTIPLRHVSARVMAHWIAPPNMEEIGRPNRIFGTPDGVDAVAPAEDNAGLRARGTEQDIETLRRMVEVLDQPLRRVRVRVRVLRLSRDDLERVTGKKNGGVTFGPSEQARAEALQQIIAAGRAVPHLDVEAEVVNNLLSTLRGGVAASPEVDVTPTIDNANGTLSMAISLKGHGAPAQSVLLGNVRDGRAADVVLRNTGADEDEATLFTLVEITPRIVPLEDDPAAERVLEAVALENTAPEAIARELSLGRSPLVESALAAPAPRQVWFVTTRANREAARQFVKGLDVAPHRAQK